MSGTKRYRPGRGVADTRKCDGKNMKAVEFDGTVTSNEDAAWRTQGRERFEAACAPEDSIYEQLMDETPTR
jgi:hypothetical protein